MRIPLHNKTGQVDELVLVPTKIIAVGRNYHAHAVELGNEVPSEPLLFFKPPSSLLAHGEPIVCPSGYQRVDYEGEMAVIIGRRGRHIRAADAIGFVLGVTCLNDVTVRDLQKSDKQWTRAKGFDTFCPLGPHVVTDLDFRDLAIETRKNGEVVQRSTTANMVHSVANVIETVSAVMTLEVGDIIAMGTPSGVGPIAPGDVVEVEIEGIGVLANPVVGAT